MQKITRVRAKASKRTIGLKGCGNKRNQDHTAPAADKACNLE